MSVDVSAVGTLGFAIRIIITSYIEVFFVVSINWSWLFVFELIFISQLYGKSRSWYVVGTIVYGSFIFVVRDALNLIATGVVKVMQQYHERVATELRRI